MKAKRKPPCFFLLGHQYHLMCRKVGNGCLACIEQMNCVKWANDDQINIDDCRQPMDQFNMQNVGWHVLKV